MYLFVAFLLPPLLGAATCWLYIALQPATKTSWQVFVGFTRDTSRVANHARKLCGCRLVVCLLTFVTCKQQERFDKIFILKIEFSFAVSELFFVVTYDSLI